MCRRNKFCQAPLVLEQQETARAVIEPRNIVLSANGVSRELLTDSLKENNTVGNPESVLGRQLS